MKVNAKKVFKNLLKKPTYQWQLYHNTTKQTPIEELSDPKDWPKEWKTVYYKGYARFEEIILPTPKLPYNKSLLHSYMKRRSSRDFLNKKISLKDLSTILYFSAGIRDRDKDAANRFYPSGGARYPLEVYVLSLNSEIPKGIYHYYLKTHSLEKLTDLANFDFKNAFMYPWAANSSCILIITSVFPRTTIKYGERGYKFSLIETGHLTQNVYLTTAALDIKCCSMAGFVDETICKLLDLDGIDEAPIHTIAIGK